MLAKFVLALTVKYLNVTSPIFIGKHLNKLKMNDFFRSIRELMSQGEVPKAKDKNKILKNAREKGPYC